MMFLQNSTIPIESLYIRFIFYVSILIFIYLYSIGVSKKLLIFYTVLASSHIYIYRYHFSSIAILFYLLSNLYLLKKFSLSKENIFDILVFLLLTSSIISTFVSFHYNGTNSIFGFFHLLSGLLLYVFFKYLDENELLHVLKYNHIFYGISLGLFSILIISNILNSNFNPNLGFNTGIISGMVGINFPPILAIFLYRKDKYKWVYFILLSFSIFVLVFTYSSASILGLIVSSFFILIYYYKFNINRKIKLIPTITMAVFFITIIIIRNQFSNNGIFSIQTIVARSSVWITYIDRVFHHSLLFGFGSNNEFFNFFLPIGYLSENVIIDLQYYFSELKTNLNAHNLYVQFFYNYGLYGFLILMGVLSSAFILLNRKLMKNELKFIEIIGYSILCAVFFQEMFDYTMIDAVTYFPTTFALGIISRYSLSFNLFHPKKNYYKISLKILFASQFFMCLFISILGFNLCISEKVKILFKNEFVIDSFSNLKFSENFDLTENKFKQFRILDSLYFPINIDDKKEQFSGQIYFEAYKKNEEKRDLDLAEKNFSKCILIFPYSAVCYKKMYEIEILKSNPDKANTYLQKSKENDPFGLIN